MAGATHDRSLGRADPAAVDGSDTEKWLAFRQAFRELESRIKIFTSLPIKSLERVKLQQRLHEIGKTHSADEAGMMGRNCSPSSLARCCSRPASSARESWRSASRQVTRPLLCSPIRLRPSRLRDTDRQFGSISGAHFNPVVTAAALTMQQLNLRVAVLYVMAQILGCCAGAILATMFELPLVTASTHARSGVAQCLPRPWQPADSYSSRSGRDRPVTRRGVFRSGSVLHIGLPPRLPSRIRHRHWPSPERHVRGNPAG